MTKLLAHYDAKLKAFVPDEEGDWPDGASAELEVVIPGEVEAGVEADEDLPPLPPFPKDAGVFFTGGPGITGPELVKLVEELHEEFGPGFPELDESSTLARKLREQGR